MSATYTATKAIRWWLHPILWRRWHTYLMLLRTDSDGTWEAYKSTHETCLICGTVYRKGWPCCLDCWRDMVAVTGNLYPRAEITTLIAFRLYGGYKITQPPPTH